jgi:hypothetical protein
MLGRTAEFGRLRSVVTIRDLQLGNKLCWTQRSVSGNRIEKQSTMILKSRCASAIILLALVVAGAAGAGTLTEACDLSNSFNSREMQCE